MKRPPAAAGGRPWGRDGSCRGQAAVEFALAFPLLIALLLATLDAGRAVAATAVLSNAMREAARYGALHHGETGWQTVAESRARSMAFTLDQARLTVVPSIESSGGNTFVRVTGDYVFQPVTPVVAWLPTAISMRANPRMVAR